ncbi:PREDICTED: uncharacterized protein LOC109147836 [Ipomoea nil]|uniref:uncharacterized protein LOC109147836 n=1 Tax=Ipomoea nil TaxID=35883 RepID=UPI000901F362|nr:PREDICTED: uncharacterized protein LOC109147836 [Ipomoea nil]
MYLNAKGLRETIKENNDASMQDRAKAMIFIFHHLDQGLKDEYLTVKESFQLWKDLKERYDHQKTQYTEKGFIKYSQLISCLLVAEQNNELLLKNHESLPIGSIPFPEVNEVSYYNENTKGSGRGYGRGCCHEKYRGQNRYGGQNFKNKSYHRKGESASAKHDKEKRENYPKNESICYRCGKTGHCERACCTSKHFVDLYQASLKGKGQNIESNNVFMDNDFDNPQLNVEDFLGPVEHQN